MFMTLATSLAVFFNCYATADILTKFYRNASCLSLLFLYLGNSQVSVYMTIGPTLVIIYFLIFALKHRLWLLGRSASLRRLMRQF